MTRWIHRIFSLWLLVAFALYAIPLCLCAQTMKAETSCCAVASLAENECSCCADGVGAEKTQTDKAFESSTTNAPSPSLLATIEFPVVLTSSSSNLSANAPCALTPPTLSFLQVFRI